MALREEFEQQGDWLFRWRSYLPLLLLPLFVVAIRESILLEVQYNNKLFISIYEIGAIAISFFGLFIRAITVGFASSGTSGRNTKAQKADSLNTTGIYATVRHPLYLGNFIIFLGIILFIKIWWFVLICSLIYWIYYERIMYREEEFLRRKFKDLYVQWSIKTPAFIPRLSQWQKSDQTFSMKKVLQSEYIGFAEIIACFTLLKISINVLKTGEFQFPLGWAIFFSTGLVVFILLRILKKRTNILEPNK